MRQDMQLNSELGGQRHAMASTSKRHLDPSESTGATSCWWFGVNNSRAKAGSTAPGHVHYRDIARFVHGDEESFVWPYGGAPGSERMYPKMRVGDRVALWTGDGVERAWGIVGFAVIRDVQGEARQLVLSRDAAPTNAITPYSPGEPRHTENTTYLKQLFGPTFRPLRKLYSRLGDENVKPYVITIDVISAEQYQSLRERASLRDPVHELDVKSPGGGDDGHDPAARTGRAYVAGVAREEIDHVFRWSQILSSDQYVTGFEQIARNITELQRRILESQYYSPAHTAYATQLAQTACVKGGHPVVNLQYGRLGHAFMDANAYSPDQRHDGTPRWWSAFSLGHHTQVGFIWEMLPEVAEALERLGWVTPGTLFVDDESPLQEPLREGAACKVVVNAFERNPVARRLCIEHHGPRCAACGFDFGTTYGPLGEGFIHVHHVIPLSQIQREYVVDPIRDLRPVCANCHAVIHLGRACRTIDEVRELVETSRKGKGAA